MTSNERYEIRRIITYADYVDISERLATFLEVDKHSDSNNEYFTRSLYFDDLYASSYIGKINGDNDRKKYRIRAYNLSDETIRFEFKENLNNKIVKKAFPLSRFQYEQLVPGNFDVIRDIDNPLAGEIYGIHNSEGLKPSVIVDYDRTAFVHPLSNTRITFDKHLRTGINSFDLFDKDLYTLHVFPNDSVIMEIKYDSYLPAHISAMISTIVGVKNATSKFCMCKNITGHVNLKDSILY